MHGAAPVLLRANPLKVLARHVTGACPLFRQALAQPGLLYQDCQDMFAAASPLEDLPSRSAYLDSSEELDERCPPQI